MEPRIFKCETCGVVAETLLNQERISEGLKCPGLLKEMVPQRTDPADEKREKHVPVPKILADGSVKVSVGTVPHPMTAEHCIIWIEIIDGDLVLRKYLHPGDFPEAEFQITLKEGMLVREYCNIHGLWEYPVSWTKKQ